MSVIAAHRNHPTYWAFILHRISGLALAIFIPFHLYVLSMAVGGVARPNSWPVRGAPRFRRGPLRSGSRRARIRRRS